MKLLVIAVVVLTPILIILLNFIPDSPPLSPLASPQLVSEGGPASPINLVRYGFLPYWNLQYLDDIDFSRLTHLSYFALTSDAQGNIITDDLGFKRFLANYSLLSSIATKNILHLDVVIKTSDDQSLFNLLNSPEAQKNLLSQLSPLVSRYDLDGLNIDFEPTTATDAATITGFTNFIKQLKVENSKLKITVDIYPSAAVSLKLWDLAALKNDVDYFIIMAYDYYQTSAPVSGPVSPLYPAKADDRHAIVKNVAQLTRLVPSQQLILGLPLYGYEWSTENDSMGSTTTGLGQLATLRRIAQLITSNPAIQSYWNPVTLTPWITYMVGNQTRQIHYDNNYSRAVKTQFARDAGLAGIAYWALGYAPANDLNE